MDIDDFIEKVTGFNKATLIRIMQHMAEIQKLYGISEAEIVCLERMMHSLQQTGYSRELTLKLLKALVAIMEVVEDEKPKEKK